MGYISYPLYLLHENMMIAFTIKFQDWLPHNLTFILPLVAMVGIGVMAYVVARYIEKPAKNTLRAVLEFRVRGLQISRR
jgi:peptidoglycan/LPS O-acetylase OafA/YrhL